jgi:SAM-dependent methyltransferase
LPQAAAAAGVEKPLDVIYISTPQDVVERMLTMARVQKDSLVYDLGCGDGRVLVTASRKYGCHAMGYDLDPRRVEEARANARQAGVERFVAAEQRDIFTVDVRPADVVFLYLNPVVNRRLIPQLQTLEPGSRIVSHSFPVGDLKPDEVVTMTSREDGQEHYIYLWTTPLRGE